MNHNDATKGTMEYEINEIILNLENMMRYASSVEDNLYDEQDAIDERIDYLESLDDSEWNDSLQKEYDEICKINNESVNKIEYVREWNYEAENLKNLLQKSKSKIQDLEYGLESIKKEEYSYD